MFLRDECKDIVKDMFYDKIFNLMMETDDERNKMKSFDILSNLIHTDD